MNYKLVKTTKPDDQAPIIPALKKLYPYLADQKKRLVIAGMGVILNTASTLLAPVIVGRTIDIYIKNKDMYGVIVNSIILLIVFIIGLVSSYILTINMGTVGREVLYKMRNAIFNKLGELPVAFFNQNKVGDLISRINNDTDKLNTFFAQVLMQFVGNIFVILGTGVMLVLLSPKLGIASLLPALSVLIVTQFVSGWVRSRNLKSLESTGSMSAEIQESLTNFRVILAFNRMDYFRKKFNEANVQNYKASVSSGVASGIFAPIYGMASALGQIITLIVGIYLIGTGNITIGLLIGFLLYVNNFYTPLRHIASIWSTIQLSMASLERINEVLLLQSDLEIIPSETLADPNILLEFREVSFGYPDGKEVLKNINFNLERGKTYALVGPTGGGKTTTASLMARLYDPTSGLVLLNGQDIRSLQPAERANKIGFILQDPFIFNGTLKDNIVYGNTELFSLSNEQLLKKLESEGLHDLLVRFNEGLQTKVAVSGDGLSLGQKQIIAFMRAVLRRPEILILDEATANIDTVTEKVLNQIISKLPQTTTKVIIAHRLNTISNADTIFFVGGGSITKAGGMDEAVNMLMHGKRTS